MSDRNEQLISDALGSVALIEGETFTLEDIKLMMGLARDQERREPEKPPSADAFGYLMEAAKLSYALSMGGQYMATSVVVTLARNGVIISVKCGARGPEMAYAIDWLDLTSCRINPIADRMRSMVKEVQQAAYGRTMDHSTDPARLPG